MDITPYLLAFLCFLIALAYADFWRHLLKGRRTPSSPVMPYIAEKENKVVSTGTDSLFEFEKFVVSKFNRMQFSCFYWRGDKNADNLSPLVSACPELEFDFMDEAVTIPISLECRWREKFADDGVHWADHQQIDRFKQYERETGRIVFVIIGIGGTAAAPEELYVVPLSKIPRHLNMLTREFLLLYKKENSQTEFVFRKNLMRLT